jgi:hypothetical protein
MNVVLRLVNSFSGPPDPGSRYDGPGPASPIQPNAYTFSWMAGHASRFQPCSVMSGQTPVATSWSIRRTVSTVTPCFTMISADASTSAWVFDTSGDRLSVPLMNKALNPEKSGTAASADRVAGSDMESMIPR